MGKLDLNLADFEDEEEALGPDSPAAAQVTLIPSQILPPAPLEGNLSPIPVQPSALAPTAGGLGPMVLIPIVDRVLATISEISRCVSNVSIEKQRTKQVRAGAEAQVEAYKQQTRQVQIQQEEETRRLAVQCKKELKLKRMELEEFRQNIQLQNAQRRDSHQTYMESLKILENAVAVLTSQSNSFCERLHTGLDVGEAQHIFQHLEKINMSLVEISREIVKLKQG